jgi:hypothetical protein
VNVDVLGNEVNITNNALVPQLHHAVCRYNKRIL